MNIKMGKRLFLNFICCLFKFLDTLISLSQRRSKITGAIAQFIALAGEFVNDGGVGAFVEKEVARVHGVVVEAGNQVARLEAGAFDGAFGVHAEKDGVEQNLKGTGRQIVLEWRFGKGFSLRSAASDETGSDIGVSWRKDY